MLSYSTPCEKCRIRGVEAGTEGGKMKGGRREMGWGGVDGGGEGGQERKKGGMEKGGPKEGSRSDSPCPVCVYVLI